MIDYHVHWFPPALVNALKKRNQDPLIEKDGSGLVYQNGWRQPISGLHVDLDMQFMDMDKHGIDTIVVSSSPIGDPSQLSLEEAREFATLVNEEYSRVQREHADRFVGLATLPLQDLETSLEVLDDAVHRLGLRGVSLKSSLNGRALCMPEMQPLWERIHEYQLPIVLHPARSVAADAFGDTGSFIDTSLGWLFDTSAAVLTFIASGLLDALPRLAVVTPHAGGVTPYAFTRVHDAAVGAAGKAYRAEHPVEYYFQNRIYTDSATDMVGALPLAIAAFGIEHTLFGSDSPWCSREKRLSTLRAAVSADDVERILTNLGPFFTSNAQAAGHPSGVSVGTVAKVRTTPIAKVTHD